MDCDCDKCKAKDAALRVLVTDAGIRRHLMENDPQALRQAEKALGFEKNIGDFPTEPIGGSNPYSRCAICKRSVPEISSRGHYSHCYYGSIGG